MNNHRKLIFDKFYQWVSDNSEVLPIEVTDVAAEIWNLEEECDLWHNGYLKLKLKIQKFNESRISKNNVSLEE